MKGTQKHPNGNGLYGQYPDIYSKDDTRYTYFFDSGVRVTLVAGEDGVTEKWIHALKLEHRREYNMLRQGQKRGNGNGGQASLRLVSLDQYMDETGEAGQALEDPTADIEGNYIAGIERIERREAIRKIFDTLTPEQRELLIRVRLRGEGIVALAEEMGVDKSAIAHRLARIEKKMRKSSERPSTFAFLAAREV